MSIPSLKNFCSVSEAAKILGISRVAVHKKIKSGKLEAQEVGSVFIIARESLFTQIKNQQSDLTGNTAEGEDKKSLNIEFEKAVRLLVEYFPPSDENSRKPILFHDIRVGTYLYENGYSRDIVLAGILHDAIEWSEIGKNKLSDEFGDNIVRLISANTKDDSIKDKTEKINDMIRRCVREGEDALIIKAADILDSFKWYSEQDNKDELSYCMQNADAIFKFKPEDFDDKIFDELERWQESLTYPENY